MIKTLSVLLLLFSLALANAQDSYEIKFSHFFPRNVYFSKDMGIAAVAHQNGTARFGKDPKTSVLDVHCRSHDIKNLFVVDGSFFVSSSAVNPSLTIMANALRVGDYIKNEVL